MHKNKAIVRKHRRSVEIQLAVTANERKEVIELRKRQYASVYPSMDLDNDVLDEQALTLYTRNASGVVDSTARLSFEGKYPLPEHEFLHEYHDQGKRLMEWGRFAIVRHERRVLKAYYRAVYNLANSLGVHAVIMAMKPRNISLHQALLGIRILESDTGETYGGQCSLACVSWELQSTRPEFFRWIEE
jgi:hypothetical protein